MTDLAPDLTSVIANANNHTHQATPPQTAAVTIPVAVDGSTVVQRRMHTDKSTHASPGSSGSPLAKRLSRRLSYADPGPDTAVQVLENLKLHPKAPVAPTPDQVLMSYKASRSTESTPAAVVVSRGGNVAKLHNLKLRNTVAGAPAKKEEERHSSGEEFIDADDADVGPFGRRLNLTAPKLAPANLPEFDSDDDEEGGSLIDKWQNRTAKQKLEAEKSKVGASESLAALKARKDTELKRRKELEKANQERMKEIDQQKENDKAVKVAAQQRYLKRMMGQG